MSDQSALLIAIVGGIGGALLAGIFQAVTSAWSQNRQERHELDVWLRQQRLQHFSKLIELVLRASAETDIATRAVLSSKIFEASIPLRTVLPESLDSEVSKSVAVVRDELIREPTERSAKAIGWQGGYLQGYVKTALGWGQEPVTRGKGRKHG